MKYKIEEYKALRNSGCILRSRIIAKQNEGILKQLFREVTLVIYAYFFV